MLCKQLQVHGKFKFCFLELCGIFFQIFLIHSGLNLRMQNPQIQGADCIYKYFLSLVSEPKSYVSYYKLK